MPHFGSGYLGRYSKVEKGVSSSSFECRGLVGMQISSTPTLPFQVVCKMKDPIAGSLKSILRAEQLEQSSAWLLWEIFLGVYLMGWLSYYPDMLSDSLRLHGGIQEDLSSACS